uniref:Uncharacterized protein n=1 Tax=Solanum lycopersicum TaxID=4081 RepID=A0A3Q7G576_SOLLC
AENVKGNAVTLMKGGFDTTNFLAKYIGDSCVKIDVYLGNTLIDMYETFTAMEEKNVISWNPMGYAKAGDLTAARPHDYVRQHDIKMDNYVRIFTANFFEYEQKGYCSSTSIISLLPVNCFHDNLFSKMLEEGWKLTHGTLISVLLVCAHAGSVDKEMKHYGCLVDLLCRSSNLNREFEYINLMPMMWFCGECCVGASKLHGNVVLAEISANKLLQLDPDNYFLSSSTYATA